MSFETRCDYLLKMCFAAHAEVDEIGREFSWKPWATDEYLDRAKLIGEAVDLLHFAGNILVGVECSDYELNAAYEEKMAINRERAASRAYTARKT